MSCNIPVSIGELWDKYSILVIKKQKIVDLEKLEKINTEISYLEPFLKQYPIGIDVLESDIYLCNLELWKIEDEIREKEKRQEFDEEFIQLARSVYFTNDKRYNIKSKINEQFNSSIYEVKSYIFH